MPQVNVRLSDKLMEGLDGLIAKDLYKDRASAIRASLEQMLLIEEQRAQGRRILALDEATIRELNIALEVV